MREYNYQPRPLIENHYHIRELFESQDKRVTDRQYHKDRIKNLEEREQVLQDSQQFTLTDFYCQVCNKDFKAQTIRQIEQSWFNPEERIAYYKTKCFQGHWCIRFITDRYRDPFWFRSKLLALDRGSHSNDTIQPYQIGYNMLYGKHK